MKYKALNNWLFLEPIREKGFAAIAALKKEMPHKARVLSVGNGTEAQDLGLKPGDIILVRKWSYEEIEFEGEKIYPLIASSVFGVEKS